MNNTKTKTFIAFIHRNKKDLHWIDGNYLYEEDAPKIYPYETKEQKELANLIGWRNTQWDEVEQAGSEIVGVVLTVSEQIIPMISKEKAIETEMKLFGNTLYESKAIKKKKDPKEKVEEKPEPVPTKIPEKIPEKIVDKLVEKVSEAVSENPEKKPRGRPRKLVIE